MKLYRYTTHGEGVWSAGKRLLPSDLVDEANENRKWMVKPDLPEGEYRFFLTELGKEKRELSKSTVLKFNETVKQHVSDEKLQHFMEVAETINELIQDKNIFNQKDTISDETNH